MSGSDSDKRLYDLCFRALGHMEATEKQSAYKQFAAAALEAGYSADDLLSMLDRGMTWAELSRMVFSALEGPNASIVPFRTVRRKGGDHDRGFSDNLNDEMRRRAPKVD